ncbi:MAG TPA: caspase family protein [Bacteroidales bacterium]|nr:caspase family protein [Bacteroidales bacterium]
MKTKMKILIITLIALQSVTVFSQNRQIQAQGQAPTKPIRASNAYYYNGKFTTTPPPQTKPTRATNCYYYNGSFTTTPPTQMTSSGTSGANTSQANGTDLNFSNLLSANSGTSNTNTIRVNIYAVIVGISNYASEANQLHFAASDAKTVYDFLKSEAGGGTPSSQMQLLLNENATLVNINKAMNNVFSKAQSNDVIYFYFSGHGSKEGYFVTSDEKALYYSIIEASFNASRAKNKICLADACYAGIYKGVKTASTTLDLAIINSKPSMPRLMSCTAAEVSGEYSELKHGVFTYFLIKGLQGLANKDNDKIITIIELYKYVKDGVSTYTNYEQNPVLNGSYDTKMPVAVLKN